MGWVKAGALIMAETIALGILSFPSVFHRIGMAPGTFESQIPCSFDQGWGEREMLTFLVRTLTLQVSS